MQASTPPPLNLRKWLRRAQSSLNIHLEEVPEGQGGASRGAVKSQPGIPALECLGCFGKGLQRQPGIALCLDQQDPGWLWEWSGFTSAASDTSEFPWGELLFHMDLAACKGLGCGEGMEHLKPSLKFPAGA